MPKEIATIEGAKAKAKLIIKDADDQFQKNLCKSGFLKAIVKEGEKIKTQVRKECDEIKKGINIPRDDWFCKYKTCKHIYDNYWFIIPENENLGYIANSSGEILSEKLYKKAIGLTSGQFNLVIMIAENDKMTFLAKDIFTTVIPPIYDKVDCFRFCYGRLLVRKNGKYGYVDIRGNEVIPLIYDKAEWEFHDGVAEVELNGKKFKIDTNGNKIRERGNS